MLPFVPMYQHTLAWESHILWPYKPSVSASWLVFVWQHQIFRTSPTPGSICWRIPRTPCWTHQGWPIRSWPVLAAATRHLLLVYSSLLDQTSKTHEFPTSSTQASLKTQEEEFQQNALIVQRQNRGENDFKPVSSAITGQLGWERLWNHLCF